MKKSFQKGVKKISWAIWFRNAFISGWIFMWKRCFSKTKTGSVQMPNIKISVCLVSIVFVPMESIGWSFVAKWLAENG
jgi:uncharacterized membrane protein YhdT